MQAQTVPYSSSSQPLPSVNLASLDAQLSDLQCVLQEGGLSGEVRERGAEAVARARTALATLTAEACQLRAKLEEQEERRSMALAALSGTPQLPSAHTGTYIVPCSLRLVLCCLHLQKVLLLGVAAYVQW